MFRLSRFRQDKSERNLRRAVALLTAAVAVWVCWGKPVLFAQSSCQGNPPPLNANHGGWSSGTNVTYQIPSDATTDQTNQMNQAFQSWSTANQSDVSTVTFQNMGSGAAGPPQLTIVLCNTAGCAPGGYAAITQVNPPNGDPITSATVTIDTTQVPTSNSDFLRATLHEIGHTMGLGDAPTTSGQPDCGMVAGGTVMNILCIGLPDPFSLMPTSVTQCDKDVIAGAPDYAPSCPPQPCDADGYTWDPSSCSCVPIQPCGFPCGGGSPILIDVDGWGYHLTDYAHGVAFDIDGSGHPIQIAWTAPGATNAFLALPGPDGAVHNGKQLFGNFTPQPASKTPNGFAALAIYDDPKNGGNGDGVIDSRDAVFASLRLWIDSNHDGISQPEELYTLSSLGVYSISLNYKWAGRRDRYGNLFRYRAQINPGAATATGRFAYDVFFVATPTTAARIPNCSVPNKRLMPAKAGGE